MEVFIGIVGIVVGIAGSLVAYFRPRIKKRLACQMTYTCYFREDEYRLPKDAKFTFQDEDVARLTKTTIVLWNKGTEELYGKSIDAGDPICVSFSEGDRILSHEFVTCTRESTAPDAVRGIADHELRLYYDYLNPGDGFALEVVHDSADSLPEVKGSVKGLGPALSRCTSQELARLPPQTNM